MDCQRCKSERILGVTGKSSDCNFFSLQGGRERDGYVLRDCNIGGGDYLEFELCLECGQVQGLWPARTPVELLPGPKFKEGDRVILLANEEEGWPEQRATVDGADEEWEEAVHRGHPIMYVVTLDDEYWDPDEVDGLREVSEDQMVKEEAEHFRRPLADRGLSDKAKEEILRHINSTEEED